MAAPKVAIAGAITDAYPSYSFTNSAISVSGQGSSLTAGGTLTLDASEGTGTASASGGGVLRVGGLTLVDTSYLSYYEPSLSVDSTSSVEIGTAGAGAAGAITVDTGVTVAMTVPASLNANVVDNGVISETGGALAISGTLSGTRHGPDRRWRCVDRGRLGGTVQIQLGASASMTLDGAATADDTIAFDGTGAALTIGAAETYNYATQSETFTPYTDAATLTGFTTGDGIIVDDSTLTNAVYTYNGNNTGTLALFAGTTAVETLDLTGNYSGRKFLLAPTTGSGSAVILLASGAGGSSPVSTTADSYSWIGSSGGSWGVASDWEDVTSDQDPAAAVPGAGDAVTISGPTGSIYEVISGGGTAASVSVSGLLDLIGTYSTGALGVGSVQVGATAVTATSGSLTLGAGTSAQVQASTVTVADGTLAVTGAA